MLRRTHRTLLVCLVAFAAVVGLQVAGSEPASAYCSTYYGPLFGNDYYGATCVEGVPGVPGTFAAVNAQIGDLGQGQDVSAGFCVIWLCQTERAYTQSGRVHITHCVNSGCGVDLWIP
jgi:hypothetical protein